MDLLSVAASIVAVIQISQQLFDLCQTYYRGVKNSRKDIKRLRDEVTALSDILTQISDLADEPGANALATLSTMKGPLQCCNDDLSLLAERLDTGHGKEMKQFGLRALKWPFSTKEVDKTLAIIDRHKNTFTLALNADQTYVTSLYSFSQCPACMVISALPSAVASSLATNLYTINARICWYRVRYHS